MTTHPSDIVERLLDVADLDARAGEPLGKACREAAAEITRLRAALADVKERCAKVADQNLQDVPEPSPDPWDNGFASACKRIAASIRGLE